MCVCTCVRIFVLSACVCSNVCVIGEAQDSIGYVYKHIYVCIHLNKHMYIYIYIYICICTHIYMYVQI